MDIMMMAMPIGGRLRAASTIDTMTSTTWRWYHSQDILRMLSWNVLYCILSSIVNELLLRAACCLEEEELILSLPSWLFLMVQMTGCCCCNPRHFKYNMNVGFSYNLSTYSIWDFFMESFSWKITSLTVMVYNFSLHVLLRNLSSKATFYSFIDLFCMGVIIELEYFYIRIFEKHFLV